MSSSSNDTATIPASWPSSLVLYHLDQGNTFFINNQYESAVTSFTAAATTATATATGDKDNQQKIFLTFRAYSHRAESYLRLKDYNNAKVDAERCHSLLKKSSSSSSSSSLDIDIDANELAMSYIRLGRAHLELKEYTESLSAFESACQVYDKASTTGLVDVDYNRDLLREYLGKCKSMMPHKETSATTATSTSTSTAKETTTEKDKLASTPTPTPAPIPFKTTKATPSTSTTNMKKRPTCPKYQYYQNDSMMTVAILEPSLNDKTIKVEFSLDKLTVIVQKGGKNFTVICGTLFSGVLHTKCKVKYMDEKVLIKLKKKHKHDWHTLFGGGEPKKDDDENDNDDGDANNDEETPAVVVVGSLGEETQQEATAAATTAATNTKHRPYASHRDWNAVERDLKREEETEKPVQGAAFNKFLQDMYNNADEDTRRAMIKSYQTSGGTHLSGNWNEVSKTDYEKQRTAPKGQEWKNWEGEKLPMKDDV